MGETSVGYFKGGARKPKKDQLVQFSESAFKYHDLIHFSEKDLAENGDREVKLEKQRTKQTSF